MRARNEVVVDRLELKRAIALTKRGRAALLYKTFFSYKNAPLLLWHPWRPPIRLVDHWEEAVGLPALALKRLISGINAEKKSRYIVLRAGL